MFSAAPFKVYITGSFVTICFFGDFGIKTELETLGNHNLLPKKARRERNIKPSANTVTVCYD